MKVWLVWTDYEHVEAAFFKEEDAEKFITDYLINHPTYHPSYGGYRPRERSDIGITDIEVQ